MFARYLSISSILMIGLSLFSPTMAMGSFQSADNSTVEKRDITITPVMNGINFPDPSVIRIGNEWWAFATMGRVNGKRVHVQMAKSAYNDFNTWISYGERDALPNLPSWVHPDSPAVWAPDVVQLGPGRFIMYYTAALKSNSKLHCLGTASASTVTGPYTPIGPDPWACPTGQGGAIDPAGYYDPKDNTRWVVYKIDANAIGHGGFCGNTVKPILSTPIMLQKVSVDNGFTKIGLPTPMIYNDPADGPYVEAPALTKMSDGTYVLFYSSNCFVTPLYDVSYATSKNIRGPYKKFGGLIKTGTYGLRAPGGLDMAINGDHAVFHADWKGGRAMFTALIRPRGNNQLQVYRGVTTATLFYALTGSRGRLRDRDEILGAAGLKNVLSMTERTNGLFLWLGGRNKLQNIGASSRLSNTTRSNALKRKNEDLAKENAQLHELYDFLRNRPFVEAEEIFRRIRSTENPLDVLRHVATADTLMAQTTTSNMQPQSHDAQSSKTNGSHVPRPGSTKYDPVYDRQ
ncbi:glycoside hydrolase family 43 protein [Aureobasidium pullulans]|nr:glycoside hydrolase family 43 protein [Aureobasidium pullulans]